MPTVRAAVCALTFCLVILCNGSQKVSAQVLGNFLERNGVSAKVAAAEYIEVIANLEPRLARAVTATMAMSLQEKREKRHHALMSVGAMSERLHIAILVAEADELAILADRLQWEAALSCHLAERTAYRARFLGRDFNQPKCRQEVYSGLMNLPQETLDRMSDPDIRETFEGMPLVIEQRAARLEFAARPDEETD